MIESTVTPVQCVALRRSPAARGMGFLAVEFAVERKSPHLKLSNKSREMRGCMADEHSAIPAYLGARTRVPGTEHDQLPTCPGSRSSWPADRGPAIVPSRRHAGSRRRAG